MHRQSDGRRAGATLTGRSPPLARIDRGGGRAAEPGCWPRRDASARPQRWLGPFAPRLRPGALAERRLGIGLLRGQRGLLAPRPSPGRWSPGWSVPTIVVGDERQRRRPRATTEHDAGHDDRACGCHVPFGRSDIRRSRRRDRRSLIARRPSRGCGPCSARCTLQRDARDTVVAIPTAFSAGDQTAVVQAGDLAPTRAQAVGSAPRRCAGPAAARDGAARGLRRRCAPRRRASDSGGRWGGRSRPGSTARRGSPATAWLSVW